jgi:hypothetical protein
MSNAIMNAPIRANPEALYWPPPVNLSGTAQGVNFALAVEFLDIRPRLLSTHASQHVGGEIFFRCNGTIGAVAIVNVDVSVPLQVKRDVLYELVLPGVAEPKLYAKVINFPMKLMATFFFDVM